MELLKSLIEGYDKGKAQFDSIMARSSCSGFDVREVYNSGEALSGRIGAGDNLRYMEDLLKNKKMAEKFQLIYVDPPFFSKARYEASFKLKSEKLGQSELIKTGAYEDSFNNNIENYLTMLTVRLLMMKELLCREGCIWVHLDWHAAHYVKILMDRIFGEENFVNEVIWTYKSGGSSRRSFAKKHDTLLFYSKSRDYKFMPLKEKSYNREMKPYRFSGVREYEDEKGWYTVVNMKDVWQLDMVGRTSQERTGYATQKPEKLMERIVKSCSEPGDLCGDFFSGSGSFGAACQKAGRNWVMCDEGKYAVADQIQRLGRLKGGFCVEEESCVRTVNNSVKAVLRDGVINLTDYRVQVEPALSSNNDVIEKYAEEDSLSLVKFWSIGNTGEKGEYISGEIVTDGHGDISVDRDGKNCGSGRVTVAGYDVFGNRFTASVPTDNCKKRKF